MLGWTCSRVVGQRRSGSKTHHGCPMQGARWRGTPRRPTDAPRSTTTPSQRRA